MKRSLEDMEQNSEEQPPKISKTEESSNSAENSVDNNLQPTTDVAASTSNTEEQTDKKTKKEKIKEKYKKKFKNDIARKKNKKNGKNAEKVEAEWLRVGEMSNEHFERYYKEQKIMPEEEFPAFLESLKNSLPTTFRINKSVDPTVQISLRDKIESYFVPKIRGLEVEEDELQEMDELDEKGNKKQRAIKVKKIVQEPKNIPWVPDRMGWSIDASKATLRKNEVLKEFRDWLMLNTNVGHITRQEAVSMLPPLFFDLKGTDRVLDMCAAPGSKTSQLLEQLHEAAFKEGKEPNGFVVGNDNDVQRCYLLVHQLGRLDHLFGNMIFTNQDATNYPDLLDENKERIQFDAILADVMCSGDGTLRKAPDLWKRWKPGLGNALHSMQLLVAEKALHLLRVGGTMVYSTCSLNPIEDEAVVAQILRMGQGAFELVDVSQKLPDMKYQPGLSTWKVYTNDFEQPKVEELVSDNTIKPSFYPPKQDESFPLHLCIRMLPHRQNTGGFFVAVIRKVKEFNSTRTFTKGKDLIRDYRGRSTAFEAYEQVQDDILDSIYNFYGINQEALPRLHFVTKKDSESLNPKRLDSNGQPVKASKIFYVSEKARQVSDLNEEKNLKIINFGMRAFEYYRGDFLKCNYRLSQEGATRLYPFMNDTRKIVLDKQDFITFVTETHCKGPDFKDEKVSEKVTNMEPGSCVVVYQHEGHSRPYAVCGFKSHQSIMRHIKKEDANVILMEITGDINAQVK